MKCLVEEAKKYLVGQPSPGVANELWYRYCQAKAKCTCQKCKK